MTMSVTAERGQPFTLWTEVVASDDKYQSVYVRGVECAYVRPSGIAPDGMYIPVELVQQLLDDELVWVNEPPDNGSDTEDLWDLGIMGGRTDAVELRNLRYIEERIYDAFLARVEAH